MNYLKGVYWDLDGTIANTELEAHLPAFNSSFNELGINWYWDKLTYIKLLKINGGKNRIYHYAKKSGTTFTTEFINKIHKKKQEIYLNLIDQGSVYLKTGVYRLISELMNKNIKQYIVTSSSRSQVDALMKNLFKDINPFEFFITSEDVDFLKPNPEPYLKAIKLSGLNKNSTLAFEDSNPGLKSAIGANLNAILVKSNIPTYIESKLNISCLIDTIGDKDNHTNVLKGPKLDDNFINYKYINKLLN